MRLLASLNSSAARPKHISNRLLFTFLRQCQRGLSVGVAGVHICAITE